MGFVHIRISANSLMARMSCARIIALIVFTKQNNAWFFQRKAVAILEKDATSYTKPEKIYQCLTGEE